MPPRPSPPSASQVHAWTEAFLASEPTARASARGSGGSGGTGGGGTGGGGGAGLFPSKRVVALYGIPGDGHSIIGRKSVKGAKRKLRRQARAYDGGHRRPVVPGFDVVAVVATSCSSRRDKCRTRQPDSLLRRYFGAARDMNGRLILDIQPGRSTFLDEVKALRPWLVKRNVDVALDPEWNVGRHGVPGQDEGSVRAGQLNRVSQYLSRLIRRRNLPGKLMIVHQFKQTSIRHRGDVQQRKAVDVTLDFDGIGGRRAKASGYKALSRPALFNGMMLFYKLDPRLMTPRQVLHLDPKPDLVVYQ